MHNLNCFNPLNPVGLLPPSCTVDYNNVLIHNVYNFGATVCYTTVVCPVCLSVCNVGVLWPNGWVDRGATWYGGRPRPKRHCVRWRPSSSRRKGAQYPPTFRPMSIVAKRSPISAIAALLTVFQLLFRCLEMFYSYWRQADDDTNDMSPFYL